MVAPEDFINSAKAMLGNDEISNRNSISRGYYGVYHIAFLFALSSLGFRYKAAVSVHKQLIDFYKSQESKELKVIGKQIEKLRNARNEADYNIRSFVSIEDAKQDLISAFHIIDQITKVKDKIL